MDFGSKEELASYREEDAAKTGHAVGSRGPGGGNEKRAHGQRRFMAGPACIWPIQLYTTHAVGGHTPGGFSAPTENVAVMCVQSLLSILSDSRDQSMKTSNGCEKACSYAIQYIYILVRSVIGQIGVWLL